MTGSGREGLRSGGRGARYRTPRVERYGDKPHGMGCKVMMGTGRDGVERGAGGGLEGGGRGRRGCEVMGSGREGLRSGGGGVCVWGGGGGGGEGNRRYRKG